MAKNTKPNRRKEKEAIVILTNRTILGLSLKKVFKTFYKDLVLPLYKELLPIIAIGIIAIVCKEYNIFLSNDILKIVILFILLRKQKE